MFCDADVKIVPSDLTDDSLQYDLRSPKHEQDILVPFRCPGKSRKDCSLPSEKEFYMHFKKTYTCSGID